MRPAALHRSVGWGTVVVFLYTGLHMRRRLPELPEGLDGVRYLFRANHIYILFAALLNVALGSSLNAAASGRTRTLQIVGSLLLVAAAPLLVVAFFLEPATGSPARPITLFGVVAAAGGTALHAIGGRPR